MRLVGDRLLFSPSDLGNYAGCEHLTQLEVAAALGEIEKPHYENPYGDLIARKGDEHERAFLESLRDAGHEIVEVELGEDLDFDAAARRTEEAMQAGAEYVYQAVLVSGGWRGIADFLERVERPSALGAWSYEVLDTKLARRPRPAHALQLCFYSEAVGEIQGRVPEVAYVVLGTRERFALRLADVTAYHRRLRSRFERAAAVRPDTEPFRCDHCGICDFRMVCEERWEREDHLIRVAGIRRDQIERLKGAGVATLTALAAAPPARAVPKLPPDTLAGLREQAELQLVRARTGRLERRLLPLEEGRGFAALPRPSPGDLFLDLEGHPFYEPARGLEFLFGMVEPDGAGPAYRAIWAHDRDAERRALEAFVDRAHERLTRHPGMHVYHFASYEPSAVKRLMGEHGTREAEVDELLRRQVFVDLHRVLRQALRAGVRSYSLKEIEALYGFDRAAPVGSGADAVLAYERWLETGEEALLAGIAAYNEEDCRATLALRDWLLEIRPDGVAWPEPPPARELPEETAEAIAERERLRLELVDGAETGSPRWLAGELLEYHRREARPAWWWYFARLGMTPEELVDDPESIGCLEPAPGVEPEPVRQSLVYTLAFPEQDHKLGPGAAEDPATGKTVQIVELDDERALVQIARAANRVAEPLPRALVPGGPYRDRDQREALARLGHSLRAGERRYPALEAILERELPRVAGRAHGRSIQTTDLEEMKALALGLEGSYLFVQGPPGTGKTWTGARLIVHLLDRGKRVGVASQSHKAIHNLLAEVETVAVEEGVEFQGLKKSTGDNPESEFPGTFIRNARAVDRVAHAGPEVLLLAGTAWLFARAELDSRLDYLVIDEAGQVSLADALAMGTSARNLILLGDPLQLAQVSQGTHPDGTGASVLEHLLDGDPTIPVERGLFLERSFRMHPDVCGFVSEVVYAGRLHSDESAARRETSFGTGIRYLPVDHDGNRTASPEEVGRIAADIGRMLGAAFVDCDGTARPLREEDFMVVAPYNAQVRHLRAGLPAGVRVGTVDKFQGQEAPVVFFSMATSSGEDVPRNLAFLFSRNRLNVAISRAQCLAVLACSPRLLEARCRTIEEMQLVNALCRLVEVGEEQGT